MQAEKIERVEGLNKIEAGDYFNKLFEDEDNSNCFNCGRKSKQWAETKHGIFFCLNCASMFKSLSRAINVKSIGLDLWKQDQIKLLQVGGNRRFKQYLGKYGMAEAEPKVWLRSKAAQYYRKKLDAQLKGKQIGPQPQLDEGRQQLVTEIPLGEMTKEQMLSEAKYRVSWAGERTKHYGTKAYETVHHKITSGQLKQDAKNVATTVTTSAKNLWDFVSTKIGQLQKPSTSGPKQPTQM